MRRLILIVLSIIALQACKQNNETYTIRVDLKDSEGKWVKLLSRVDREYVTYDSAMADAGSPALLSRSVDGVSTMYLAVDDAEGNIQLLVENSNYKISGSLEDPVIETDSKAQNDLNEYNAQLRPLTDRMNALVAELRKGPGDEGQDAFNALREEYFTLYDQRDEMDSAYVAGNPDSYASVLALRSTFYQLDDDQLEAALSRLDPALQQMEEYVFMKGKLDKMKAVAVGQKYTDFGLETPEGEVLSVSDVHNGQVLMLDFWASWCGPCRRANPEVVQIYNDYKDAGFEILGVSLDRDSANWVQAIEDDQLAWKHISDLQYWNSAGAELYGVSAIPHTVLIDRDGTIIAKNLDGDGLREAIEAHL